MVEERKTEEQAESEEVDRFFTIPQAARILGCVNATVKTYIAHKRLENHLVGGHVVITKESVRRLRQQMDEAAVGPK